MRPVDSSRTHTVRQNPPQPESQPQPAPQKAEEPKKKGFLGRVKDGFDGAVDKGKDLADKAGDKVGDLKDKAVDKGQELKDKAVDKGEELADKAGDKVGELKDKVVGAGEVVLDRAGDIADTWKDALDYEQQIDKLGKGDKYTLAVGADASVEGGKAYAKAQIEVSRDNEGKYVVTSDGEAGAGLYGQLGGKVGGNASVDGEALVGAGGKVEMKFDSAEEAKRATDALVRLASPPVAALKGAPSKEDLGFLKDHVSAVELKGNGVAKIAAEAGVGVANAANLGVFAKGEIKSEMSLRIEFEKGKDPSITLKQEFSGQVEAGGQAGPGLSRGTPGQESGGGVGWALQGKGKGTVSIETKLSAPKIDPAKLALNPEAELAKAGFKALETTTTVTGQFDGTVGKNGTGLEAKLVVKNSGAKALDSGAIKHALNGDFEKAAESAAGASEVEASLTEYDVHGVAAAPELRVMGFGGKLEIESLRTDKADKPLHAFKGSGKEAATAFAGWLSEQKDAVAMNQQVSAGRYGGVVRA